MINTLGFSAPGPIEWVIILVIVSIPIFVITLIVRFFKRSNAERRRLRMELSKLADELEQTRKNQSGK